MAVGGVCGRYKLPLKAPPTTDRALSTQESPGHREGIILQLTAVPNGGQGSGAVARTGCGEVAPLQGDQAVIVQSLSQDPCLSIFLAFGVKWC
jgi:hypothetical protein